MAGEAPQAAQPVERLIASLTSTDYATREAATTQLMVREDLDDGMMKAAFQAARTPEQTHRLIRIALHRFYRNLNPAVTTSAEVSEGGLGVATRGGAARIVRPHQHPELPGAAFLVTETLPGFPAYAYLRSGDLILAIGDTPVNDETSFSETIRRYRAGDRVRFRLMRYGHTLEVSFALDSLGRLQDVYKEGPLGETWAASRPDFQRYLASLRGEEDRVAATLEIRKAPEPQAPRAASASARNGNIAMQ
jgi:C-terminal processing protease CtpA/Prc